MNNLDPKKVVLDLGQLNADLKSIKNRLARELTLNPQVTDKDQHVHLDIFLASALRDREEIFEVLTMAGKIERALRGLIVQAAEEDVVTAQIEALYNEAMWSVTELRFAAHQHLKALNDFELFTTGYVPGQCLNKPFGLEGKGVAK